MRKRVGLVDRILYEYMGVLRAALGPRYVAAGSSVQHDPAAGVLRIRVTVHAHSGEVRRFKRVLVFDEEAVKAGMLDLHRDVLQHVATLESGG